MQDISQGRLPSCSRVVYDAVGDRGSDAITKYGLQLDNIFLIFLDLTRHEDRKE
jgi:hypothetical protein